MEFTHPVEVTALEAGQLLLVFDNGEKRKFDVKPYMAHAFFSSLRDTLLFGTAKIKHGTVEWGNGVDIAPDDLYFNSVRVE